LYFVTSCPVSLCVFVRRFIRLKPPPAQRLDIENNTYMAIPGTNSFDEKENTL
jgi:hypothetical protein